MVRTRTGLPEVAEETKGIRTGVQQEGQYRQQGLSSYVSSVMRHIQVVGETVKSENGKILTGNRHQQEVAETLQEKAHNEEQQVRQIQMLVLDQARLFSIPPLRRSRRGGAPVRRAVQVQP